MKYRAIKEIQSAKGFEYQGAIHEGDICEVKMFEGFPTIFYKGKAVCDTDSQMCKDCFKEVSE